MKWRSRATTSHHASIRRRFWDLIFANISRTLADAPGGETSLYHSCIRHTISYYRNGRISRRSVCRCSNAFLKILNRQFVQYGLSTHKKWSNRNWRLVGGGFRGESRIYSIDMLLVCRCISVIYDVSGFRICVGVVVPATSTFSNKKRMKVNVVVDCILESVIYW